MTEDAKQKSWYVLRDLRRHNARKLAYEELEEAGFEVFVPLMWNSYIKNGREIKRQVPVVCGLLFAHSTRSSLNAIIERIDTLQYRYLRGAAYCTPMTVGEAEMNSFISVVSASAEPCYYQPGEVNPNMIGFRVRLIGGPMDGQEGRLMKVRGRARKRLYVEIPGIIGASVIIHAESVNYIEVPDIPKGEIYRAHAAKAEAARLRIEKARAEEEAALKEREERIREIRAQVFKARNESIHNAVAQVRNVPGGGETK